jgi:hypothetical protein
MSGGTPIWNATSDLEAQGRQPLVDDAQTESIPAPQNVVTDAPEQSTGSVNSPDQSPAANPNALAGIKFKTTYEFELDLSAKLFLFLVRMHVQKDGLVRSLSVFTGSSFDSMVMCVCCCLCFRCVWRLHSLSLIARISIHRPMQMACGYSVL